MPLIGSVSGSSGFGRGTLAGAPSWITAAGSIGTLNDNQRGNTLSVEASPGPGAVSVTYSVASGSLPTGASLNGSTGVISGFGPVDSNTTSSFTLRATNNAGLTADRAFSITINAVTITFNSPAAGAFAGQNTNTSFSRTYSATVSSGTVTYASVSGTIPSGTSINSSTGAHTGTLSSAASFSWTVRATGTSGAVTKTVDRAFSIVVTSQLYAFTNATFTPGGQTGRFGPSLAQARSGMSGTPAPSNWNTNTSFFNTSNGIQLWTVPQTGTYRIEAWGAQGTGFGGLNGGLGARMRGDVTLTEGEIIRILVGQQSNPNSDRVNLSSPGGGGSFVVRTPYNTNQSILVIAGGGGGTGNQRPTTSNATTSTSGQTGSHGSGGTNGNGGTSGTSSAGAGGGFLGNGVASGSSGGDAFVNGGLGGIVNSSWNVEGGGFGGGGSITGGGNSRYGGGGGYSGGSGSSSQSGATTGLWGGGGGSFNSGANQSNTEGARSGAGQVQITLL